RIIAEGPGFLIVDKPALLDSQNSRKDRTSLVDWLKSRYGYSGLVHRLDFGTSGCVACAKNPDSARDMTEELLAGRLERIYVALVFTGGRQSLPDTGVMDSPLDGKDARTRFRVLER